jgi:predicted O-methyltransferase YrrM
MTSINIRRYLRPYAYIRYVDHAISSYLESRIGKDKLIKRFPELAALPELQKQKRNDLLPFYQEYVANVSLSGITLSLELATFLGVLCEIIKPQAILDLGSGFSSFVLRRFAAQSGQGTAVWSIDDHGGWLEKTREFLDANNMPVEHMGTWEAFSQGNEQSFDLIFHDLGSMVVRGQSLEKVLAMGRRGSVAVLDDIHDHKYRAHVAKVVGKGGYEQFSLKWCTVDGIGRYSALVGM